MTESFVRSARAFLPPLTPRTPLIALAMLALALPAFADDFVSRVNDVYASTPTARRSDLVILPLLAQTTPPPVETATLEQAALLPSDAASFKSLSDWAGAAPQQAVVKALRDLSQETDWRQAAAFAQPYGSDAIPPALVRAGLYTELGDPPTLAAARHLYLPALDRAAMIANVHATRLQGEGKPGEAIDALTDWAYFCRSMCDRQFHEEAAWGLRHLAQAFARIRDVAYVDMRAGEADRKIQPARLIEQIRRLSGDDYLDITRMTFPIGDRAGTEQMIARVYVPRGRVDEKLFGPSMARLGSSEHPLRIFSETAQWRDSAGMQSDWFKTSAAAAGVYDDWAGRWNFDFFDPHHANITEWQKMGSGPSFSVVRATTPDMATLFDLRQIAKVEGVGTRTALAALGTFYSRNSLPPQLSAVRPRYVQSLDDDPFNPSTRNVGGKPPLEYFVPMRDTPRNARGDMEPYAMDVVTSDPSHPLSLRMTDDTFVMYSWGSDFAKNFAKRTQNTAQRVEGADYLIWPPILSLERTHRLTIGSLK